MKSNFKLVALAIVAGLCTLNAYSATRTWNGNSNSNWSAAANWSGNSVPGNGDLAVIPAGLSNYPVLSSNTSVGSITLNGGSITNGATTKYNLTVSNGNFTINAGTVNFIGSTLTVNSSYDLIMTGGTVYINGSSLVVRDANVSGGLLDISNSNLTFTNDFTFSGGTLNLNSYNLYIEGDFNNYGGSLVNPGELSVDKLVLNFTGTKTLDYNLTISGSASFISGILTASDNYLVTFASGASISGGSGAASDISHINGKVRKLIANSSNSTFSFPVGNGVRYAQIEISGHQQSRSQDYFTAWYVNERHPLAGQAIANSLTHVSQAEYWILDRAASSGTPTTDVYVRLSFNETNRSGLVNNINQLRVSRWNGSNWEDHGSSSTSGNNTSGSIRSSARLTEFSPFTLASTSTLSPLPISLLNFNAEKQGNDISVNWQTTSEINNDYFTVYKSFDGENWVEAGIVKSQGNSDQVLSYRFIDQQKSLGRIFYKLKQTDLNGSSTLSGIVTVQMSSIHHVTIYPNPASTNLSLEIDAEADSDLEVEILDAFGRLVSTQNFTGNRIDLDISAFKNGVYTIRLSGEGVNQTQLFVKN